jgi:enterochelin esterase-like enzyme
MAGLRWTRQTSRAVAAGTAVLTAAFIALGFVGVDRYARNYWLYRGFPPPVDPGYVTVTGTQERIDVTSAALGGRTQPVYVYLPPGYDTHPDQRYPVIYLLHGFPGRPLAFMLTVRMGVVEDELYAKNLGKPAILVMPYGSTGIFTDKEWADGVSPNEGWATFVARDVVNAVDSQYRTIPRADGRAIAGLSEGGYGAINIALHHPKEFGVVESWSGYERPAHDHAIFGRNLEGLAANSPFELLPQVAHGLQRTGTYFWFYSGTSDPSHKQNEAFAAELKHFHIAHAYRVFPGGHNWAIWRGEAQRSYLSAVKRLAGA